MQEVLEKKKSFDAATVRKDFPILSQKIYGKPLIYFDNAATSQKPQVVIDALTKYYTEYNANIHRGVHYLSQKASEVYDAVRGKVQQFINARSEKEIIFVRGTTEAINLVAATYGRKNIQKGDEVIVSAIEHHSNIVPWQMLCEEKGAVLKVIPMNEKGEILVQSSKFKVQRAENEVQSSRFKVQSLEELITTRTKFISVVHTSNSLGTINPVKKIIEIAHRHNIPVLVDAAQATVHSVLDVQELDCDFLAFSGHKMLGPTGVGVLYGKLQHLEAMPPYQGGGDMISSVSFEKTTYNEVPFKFEAGTQNVADVIALGVAMEYLQGLDRKAIATYEQELMKYASDKLSAIEGVRLIGTASEKTSVVSFVIEGLNAMDVGMYLDTKGIAVRTGHHCTEPVMDFLKIPGTIRASFLFYNTKEEIDRLVEETRNAIKLLKS